MQQLQVHFFFSQFSISQELTTFEVEESSQLDESITQYRWLSILDKFPRTIDRVVNSVIFFEFHMDLASEISFLVPLRSVCMFPDTCCLNGIAMLYDLSEIKYPMSFFDTVFLNFLPRLSAYSPRKDTAIYLYVLLLPRNSHREGLCSFFLTFEFTLLKFLREFSPLILATWSVLKAFSTSIFEVTVTVFKKFGGFFLSKIRDVFSLLPVLTSENITSNREGEARSQNF
jgi:hypothetical protein